MITTSKLSPAVTAVRTRCGFRVFRASTSSSPIPPPVAKRKPHRVPFGAVPGETRGEKPFDTLRYIDDPWFWLRDDERKDPEIIQHLELENAYTAQETGSQAALRAALYDEHLSHLQETDNSPAWMKGAYWYYTRTIEGKSYKLHCRKPFVEVTDAATRRPQAGAAEQVLLDENALAEGLSHCDVHAVRPSPCHTKLAYAVDKKGDEVYTLVVKDLGTGEDLPDSVDNISAGGIVWLSPSQLLYTTLDSQKRPYKLWRHVLGTPCSEDTLLFTEDDEMFWLGASKSLSGRVAFVATGSTETTEIFTIDLATDGAITAPVGSAAARATPTMRVVQARRFGLRYDVEHDGADGLVIWTNKDKAVNQRLMRTPLAADDRSEATWVEMIPYKESRMIEDVSVFASHIVLEGRENGLTQVWLLDKGRDGSVRADSLRRVCVDEAVYEIGVSSQNCEFAATHLRLHYSSLTTPTQWRDVELSCDALKSFPAANPADEATTDPNGFPFVLVKEQAVPNFDRTKYVCRRIFATAPDKTKIPISIVHLRSLATPPAAPAAGAGATKKLGKGAVVPGDRGAGERKGEAADEQEPPQREASSPLPLMLYGYGSYGVCIDPSFHKLVLPYLDRGMVYAIAHIRGGGEMGRSWYEEQGKYLTKRNTFSDFIACAEHLVTEGWTTPAQMACEGRSAGGLLMGNVANMRPDLFKVMVAGVPFVDLMCTMSDPSIPLTSGEWEEWGNPNEAKYFDYMLSYSPMDNVRAQPYPNILITAGLHDPRVAYWEAAKWASRLRAHKTNGDTSVVLKLDLSSGHFSASDRYKYLREKSFDQAFVLANLGLDRTSPAAAL